MVSATDLAERADELAGLRTQDSGLGFSLPDAFGRFGQFGGQYAPETLMPALEELNSDVTRARSGYAQARYDYYLAQAGLARAVGRLPQIGGPNATP